jgi:hypothetical protein
MTRNRTAYSAEADAEIHRLHGEGFKPGQIATAMGLQVKSISSRMVTLRKEGRLPGYISKPISDAISLVPPITLREDDSLVSRCLSEGGFPTAVSLAGRTFWIKADGSQWAHTPPKARRVAA